MANNGILMYTLPLFYPELIAEFGWNAEEVTRPAALFFVVAALLTPFMGALFDRYPTKRVMMFGILALVAGLACYPFVTSLAQLTAIYMVFAVGLAGCGLVPHMLILSRWFKRYRGLAAGLLLSGSSFGGAIFPLIAKETLLTQGWRPALALVAIIGSVMMLIAALWLVRNSPQELGLAPDGAAPDEPAPATPGAGPASAPAGVTLRQAAATPVFYLLAFVTATLWFCIVGMLQHQSIFLSQDLGVDRADLPLIFSLFFWAAIIGKFAFGWLSDLFNKGVIMLLAVLCFAAGLALLPVITADNKTLLQLYAVLFGVGFGGTFSMIQAGLGGVLRRRPLRENPGDVHHDRFPGGRRRHQIPGLGPRGAGVLPARLRTVVGVVRRVRHPHRRLALDEAGRGRAGAGETRACMKGKFMRECNIHIIIRHSETRP